MTNTNVTDIRLLTVEEASAILRFNPHIIRAKLREGRIKGIYFNKRWRIHPDELARVMREGEREPDKNGKDGDE
jgi:hypothetical protein